ncbi:MAG: YciI family protein [Candidatus Thermochlorobacter sp.]
MKYFVVEMICNEGRAPDLMKYAGEHIKWMLETIPKRVFVLGGPFINESGEIDDGFCIMKAESKEALEDLLKTETYHALGIRRFTVREWDYHVDEGGYRIDFPPHLAEAWGVSATPSQMRITPQRSADAKYFVVQMTCNDGRAPDVMKYAGEHIKWMLDNIPKGMFVAAGPFINAQGAFDDGLCVVTADSKEALEEVLKSDPFYTMGIRNFSVRPWAYFIDEGGYRIDFPPHLAEAWGVPAETSKMRIS